MRRAAGEERPRVPPAASPGLTSLLLYRMPVLMVPPAAGPSREPTRTPRPGERGVRGEGRPSATATAAAAAGPGPARGGQSREPAPPRARPGAGPAPPSSAPGGGGGVEGWATPALAQRPRARKGPRQPPARLPRSGVEEGWRRKRSFGTETQQPGGGISHIKKKKKSTLNNPKPNTKPKKPHHTTHTNGINRKCGSRFSISKYSGKA